MKSFITGYDNTFLLKAIPQSNWQHELRMNVLADSSEKLRQIRLNRYLFRDSMEHLTGSLDNIVQSVLPEDHEFVVLFQALLKDYPTINTEVVKPYIRRKLPFPHEYFTHADRTLTPLSDLTPKHFDNSLANRKGTEKEVRQMHEIASLFHLENLGDLLSLYCKIDTLLLMECLLQYSSDCQASLDLAPFRYLSTSSLSLNFFLKSTNIKLPLCVDESIYRYLRDSALIGGFAASITREVRCPPHSWNPQNDIDYETPQEFAVYMDFNSL